MDNQKQITSKTLYDARAEAVWAYTYDRSNRARYDAVVKADNALVDFIASNRSEQPLPVDAYVLGGKSYILQSYRKGTARYVLAENYNPDKYVYEPVTKRYIVVQEISAMRKIDEAIQALIDVGVDPFNS